MRIIEGYVYGKTGRGRLIMEYIRQIIEDTRVESYREPKDLSYDRETWRAAANHF